LTRFTSSVLNSSLARAKQRVALPYPNNNWGHFMAHLEQLMSREKAQWNLVKVTQAPWIDMKKLDSLYESSNASKTNRRASFTGGAILRRLSVDLSESSTTAPPRARRNLNTSHSSSSRSPSVDPLPEEDTPERTYRRQTTREYQGSFQGKSTIPSADLTLTDVLKNLSHQAPELKGPQSLQTLLVSVPTLFPPQNAKVEATRTMRSGKSSPKMHSTIADMS
jgi:hypothetical protein